MRVIVLTMVVLVACIISRAQATKDPIDKNLDACLNSPSGASTVGQNDCVAKAYADWDAELNKVYRKLMKDLDPSSRDLLRASQRQWVVFRDAEKKFQAAPWRQKGGTVIGVSVGLDNVEALRARVTALRTYAAVAK